MFPWSLKHDMLCGVHLFFNFKGFTFPVILSEKKVEFVWTWKQYSLENFTGAEYVAKVASRWGGVLCSVQCTEGKWWRSPDLGGLVWGQPKIPFPIIYQLPILLKFCIFAGRKLFKFSLIVIKDSPTVQRCTAALAPLAAVTSLKGSWKSVSG